MKYGVVAALLACSVLTGCGSDDSNYSTHSPAVGETGTDREVTFTSGPVTLHGSLRMPADTSEDVPAVLLLAGSGPTDRNGNSALLRGNIGTMSFLADELARKGYASLRFDKLGTGATGLGPYTTEDLAGVGFDALIGEGADGLRFLAAQDGIDETDLGIVGHSEGALIALAIATGRSGDVPAVNRLGLVQPMSERILDGLSRQVGAQIDAAVANGNLPVEEGDSLHAALDGIVTQLRENGTLPDDVPAGLQAAGLVAANAKALADEDALDPVQLADAVNDSVSVLTSCSEKDIQVRCEDVERLDAALAGPGLQTVRLTDTNHVLKVVGDQPSTGAEYVQPLPFSPEFATAFGTWLASP